MTQAPNDDLITYQQTAALAGARLQTCYGWHMHHEYFPRPKVRVKNRAHFDRAEMIAFLKSIGRLPKDDAA